MSEPQENLIEWYTGDGTVTVTLTQRTVSASYAKIILTM